MFGAIMNVSFAQIMADGGKTDVASAALGVPFTFQPLDESDISGTRASRLREGQVVLQPIDGGAQVYLAKPFQNQLWVLSVYFRDFRTSHMRGTLNLLRMHLSRLERPIKEAIPVYAEKYHIPMRLLPPDMMQALQLSMSEISPPNHVRIYDFVEDTSYYYAWLPEIEALIEVGPVKFRKGISPLNVIVIILMGILLTAIAVFWLVHTFELRLQRLERATSRIAQGHLNSRVKLTTVDSVGRLGMAFNKMAEQIQRLMGVQKEMIRAVSHELRTPVARMRFGVQMLEDTVGDAYVQKQLNAMDGDLEELDELIDEILTYARLEEGGPILEFKTASVVELVEQVVDETRRRTDKVDIQSDTNTRTPAEVESEIEYRYMHRAVQNLVGNACRYAVSKVHISYHYKDGVCRIDVEDDGPGIPEEDWERVFSPFTRLDDSRTRSTGGYGLGLSIVRRIIYWHSGKALVNRSRWGGAKMSLVWPKITLHKHD